MLCVSHKDFIYKRVLLNRAPTSSHLHPAPFSSTQLHQHPSAYTQILSGSIQLSAKPQRYKSQNIARNWAISPNLGRKIKSCPFWLKIGTHGILEVLILNPTSVFWNFNLKSIFGQTLPENWLTEYLEDIGSCSDISFLTFQT